VSGIAGVIGEKNEKECRKKIKILLDKIPHRGDKRKIFRIGDNCFGINSNSDNKIEKDGYLALLDGKIYNINDLVTKYNITTTSPKKSDEQKIILLFEKLGKEIFKELKGSYSLILVDKQQNIFCLRDVIGIKPLYYSKDKTSDAVLIASEIKSLIELTNNIKEFPPGSIMINFNSSKAIKEISLENFPLSYKLEKTNIENKLENHLINSVDRRTSNNFSTYGVWLSGGLDSSIIAAILKEFTEEVYTFSVGFKESPDLNSAKIVSEYLGTKHTEYELDVNELFSSIPKVIYYLESFDAPLVRSSLGNAIASKISSSADVVFSGEGGDELFAGYDYFLDLDSKKSMQRELLNSVNSLHNTALQRVDRLANAYSVNIKLPILDEKLVNYSLKISPGKKVRRDKNISKYILRKVASNYLPDSIAWRKKDKFWEGAGIVDTISKRVDKIITNEEFIKSRKISKNFILRNKEELYYYKTFKTFYPDLKIENVLSLTQDFN